MAATTKSITQAAKDLIAARPYLGPSDLIAALAGNGFDVRGDAALAEIAVAAGVPAAQIPERIARWRPTAATNRLSAPPAGGFVEPEAAAPQDALRPTDAVGPDSKRAADFILSLPPGIRNVCFAHIEVGTKKASGFACKAFKDRAALIALLDAHQGKANCYYSLNPLLRPIAKKAERKDIARVVALHVDIDPGAGEPQSDAFRRIVAQLQTFHTRPSTVIASGGGIQALWFLETPVEVGGDLAKAEDAKLYNKQLETELGGDNCHNIDRILRVPYTLNIPDKKKAAKGRLETLAYVVWDEGTRYPLDRFKKAPSALPNNGAVGSFSEGALPTVNIDALPVSPRIRQMIRTGTDPDGKLRD